MTTTLSTRPVEQGEWAIMREQAKVLVTTGFLPTSIKTPEQAVAIMLKGRELGIPPMYALSNIAVIQGKPTANAELMLALIYRDHGDNAIWFEHTDAEYCTIEYRRKNWPDSQAYTFRLQDAKTAGLTGNQTWQKYPQAMLRARCISAVARMAFADTIGGLYTPEELGARVRVADDGEIVVIEASEVEQAPPAAEYVPPVADDRQARYNLLSDLRSQVRHLGGTVREVTTRQIKAMSDAQLQAEMEATRQQLDEIQAEVATEAQQAEAA